jgi:hypothetical protein
MKRKAGSNIMRIISMIYLGNARLVPNPMMEYGSTSAIHLV